MAFPPEKNGRLTIGLAVGLVVGAAGGWFFGWARGGEQVRVEAVKAGHARHKIVDEYGRTQFEWMPNGTSDPGKK